ncbi:hypothetical protein HBA55_02970 [Pseudomaricurvus alkylphenolicus]|uniref:hypothetical protein n=1 Tax=Pseudomaricurvus alkylphenolicus TaxID=1306991 RepID=UPI00142189B8|nr:hypothetical protein [Pseudomaricurvus alkylphenolicus]NIB38528.1 hypothetical protein [Pseudomaricurvus alkylphenolicus]
MNGTIALFPVAARSEGDSPWDTVAVRARCYGAGADADAGADAGEGEGAIYHDYQISVRPIKE